MDCQNGWVDLIGSLVVLILLSFFANGAVVLGNPIPLEKNWYSDYPREFFFSSNWLLLFSCLKFESVLYSVYLMCRNESLTLSLLIILSIVIKTADIKLTYRKSLFSVEFWRNWLEFFIKQLDRLNFFIQQFRSTRSPPQFEGKNYVDSLILCGTPPRARKLNHHLIDSGIVESLWISAPSPFSTSSISDHTKHTTNAKKKIFTRNKSTATNCS